MSAIGTGRKVDQARSAIDIKLERVCAIDSVSDHEAWQVLADWFTSPYWYAPPHLTQLLIMSKPECRMVEPGGFHLVESASSAAIHEIAQSDVDVDDRVALSLVDRFVFGDMVPGGARVLAEGICHGERDAVLITLDSGHVVTASLAATMAWIAAESIRHGFPEEVTHGYRSLMREFVAIDESSGSTGAATAVSLAVLMPLPGGIAERAKISSGDLAIPLPAYPLVAMILPEHSASMFPTYDALPTLLAGSSPGGRQGRLKPLGKWEIRLVEAKFSIARPFARPTRFLAGMVARGLARSRDRVAASRVGSVLVPSGASLGWVWSLLRSASSVGGNPWLTRSSRGQLDQAGIMEVQQ